MPLKSYKGFNADMSCRGLKFALGGEYTHDGDVKACSAGFHACEYPLDVLQYYPPATSVYAEVEQDGEISKHGDDSKVASNILRVKASISLSGLIKAAIDYTFARSTPEGEKATGYRGAASATGYSGAASATGDRGAALATGYRGKVKGALGCALLLVERDESWNIIATAGAVVGKKGIKPDVWYTLSRGKFVQCKN
jgi:hypothetical protein